MPISISLGLIVVISLASYLYLRPLQILTNLEWVISHSVIMVALTFILAWLWVNRAEFQQTPLLMAGVWGFAGGICYAVVFVVRKFKGGAE